MRRPLNQTPRRLQESVDHHEQRPLPGLVVAGIPMRPSATNTSPNVQEPLEIQKILEGLKRRPKGDGNDTSCQSRDTSHPRSSGPPLPPEKRLHANLLIAKILDCPSATYHFWEATLLPPVTKPSLGELDISSIMNNSKLRHDINFDRELHFRPNLDGHKGQMKREAQKGYWQAITAELEVYRYMCESSMSESYKKGLREDCERRIPQMFETVKDILKNLVPDRDQPAVDEHLDVPMVMQEIAKGVCDFISIAVWLAQLLKRHCAPMRDEMVDRMVEKIRKGDSASISAGLCELFSVLEAMKLVSVAHSVKHFIR